MEQSLPHSARNWPNPFNSTCCSQRSLTRRLLLLLLLLSRFSRVRLYATPSLGFSRQEHWAVSTGVGCHFILQFMKVKSESEVAQSCPTLCNCTLPGPSVHGIFQARVLEWGAIAFSVTRRQWTLNRELVLSPDSNWGPPVSQAWVLDHLLCWHPSQLYLFIFFEPHMIHF